MLSSARKQANTVWFITLIFCVGASLGVGAFAIFTFFIGPWWLILMAIYGCGFWVRETMLVWDDGNDLRHVK